MPIHANHRIPEIILDSFTITDCNKQCPPGGKPSADCDVCECYNVTLIGKVNVSKGSSVGNASIFLESRPNQSLGETNEFGTFQISGVCLMNEQVIIGKAGYSSEIGTPTEVNTSHWRIEAIITKHGEYILFMLFDYNFFF